MMKMFNIMRDRLMLTLFILFCLSPAIFGQTVSYTIAKTALSSDRYDELWPAYYKNGIVFCSNREVDLMNKYSTLQGKGFLKIFYIDSSSNKTWQDAHLFSKNLKTRLNDGPVSFSSDLNTIYFSHNIYTEGNAGELSSQRNKLGLFSSEFDGEWRKPQDFRYNTEWYNITAPCLSPDGTHLFFASDKPGGYGGSDIYYCTWEKDYWSNPINIGPKINSPGNETSPFMCTDGELYFSSDGHGGFGGKDIFFTKLIDTLWMDPVHLNTPINSKFDDVGLITDKVMKSGYFSSNRDGTYDIFSFKTIVPQIFYCQKQIENQYCYEFKNGIKLEQLPENLQYWWSFGDSKTTIGENAEHCFSGPGVYVVEEYVVDKKTDSKIFTKMKFNLEIKDVEQPYITSDDYAITGGQVNFSAGKSNLPDKKISQYIWDFGDGVSSSDEAPNHKFSSPGEYSVKLRLALKDIKTGEESVSSVYKNVKVFDNADKMNSYVSDNNRIKQDAPEVTKYDHAFISDNYQALSDDRKSFLFEVCLLTSKTKIGSDNVIFKNLASLFFVKEVYDSETGNYNYIVSEEPSFMRSYIILNKVLSLGFRDAIIQTRFFNSEDEKNLFNLRLVYGNSADLFFGKLDSRLTSPGFTYFDQVITLLNRYPEAKLLIESHTDRAENSAANLSLSIQRAQAVASYISSRGIKVNRLIIRGYGDSRPLSLNNSEEEKKKNQRIDLMIIR